MRLLALISLVMLQAAYQGPEPKPAANAKPKGAKKPTVLTGRCAVIVRPDNKKIAFMKKHSSQDEYATVVNDNEYYMGVSVGFLDSTKVRQIAEPAHGVVTFKSSTGHYFNLSLAPFQWGIILFNGRAKPLEADITDIETSYRTYMKK